MRPWPATSSAVVTGLTLSLASLSAQDSVEGGILDSIEYRRPAYETLARQL